MEHIIPESLGNEEHTLPPGVVCDHCNNYFGLKVEAPLLDTPFFREARSRNYIPNKRNILPSVHGILLPAMIPVELMDDLDGHSMFARNDKDAKRLFETLQKNSKGELIVPVALPPDERLMSRFLAKVGLEVLASRSLEVPDGMAEIVDMPELNSLRLFARFNTPSGPWPFNVRRIYPEGKRFREGLQDYEILHEYRLLYTESAELYLILAILGMEYAINLAGPEVQGYLDWLTAHDSRSPLYV